METQTQQLLVSRNKIIQLIEYNKDFINNILNNLIKNVNIPMVNMFMPLIENIDLSELLKNYVNELSDDKLNEYFIKLNQVLDFIKFKEGDTK